MKGYLKYFYLNVFYYCLCTEWVEVEDTYALSAVNTLQEAVNTILKYLGLGSADGSEKVNEGVHTHTLLCSGKLNLILVRKIVNRIRISTKR